MNNTNTGVMNNTHTGVMKSTDTLISTLLTSIHELHIMNESGHHHEEDTQTHK